MMTITILTNPVSFLTIKVDILILIIASESADASGDESAAKYSEMSAILGFLGHVRLKSDV